MLKLKKGQDIDIDLYFKHLKHLGFLYYSGVELDLIVRKMAQKLNTIEYLILTMVKECSGVRVNSISRHNIINFLKNHKNVPESMLYNKKTNDDSISKEKLALVHSKGYANEFIDLYLEFTSLRSVLGFTESALRKCIPSDLVDYEDKGICMIRHNKYVKYY